MKSTLSILNTNLLGLVVLVGLSTGCANGPKVHSQTSPGVNYTRFHSFAVMPPITVSPESDPVLMSRFAEPARRTAIETLASFGLREAKPDDADLIVTMRGEFAHKEKITEWGYLPAPVSRVQLGSYQGGDRPRGKTVTSFEERTLSIDVVDNRTKQLAWRGELAATSNQPLETDQVQEAIRRVLSEFSAGPQIASITR